AVEIATPEQGVGHVVLHVDDGADAMAADGVAEAVGRHLAATVEPAVVHDAQALGMRVGRAEVNVGERDQSQDDDADTDRLAPFAHAAALPQRRPSRYLLAGAEHRLRSSAAAGLLRQWRKRTRRSASGRTGTLVTPALPRRGPSKQAAR